MRAPLKGVYRHRKVLSDGSPRYYYTLRGVGTIKPLAGDEQEPFTPGSPAFMRAYHALNAAPAKARTTGTMQQLLDAYQRSTEWAKLAVRTKRDYIGAIAKIEAEYARHPIEVLVDPKIRPRFLGWRDRMAKASPRQADAVFGVLRIVLAWAHDRGLLSHNYATRPKKVYKADRSDHLWLPDHIAAFRAVAAPDVLLAFELGLSTGQRKGDLLTLGWSCYDGKRIKFRQGKKRRLIDMPVTADLMAVLDAAPRTATTILARNGKPWGSVNFDHRWRETIVKAGLNGLHFHDLRGTACTKLAEAGATPSEIAAVLGWTVASVNRMLDTYQSMTAALSDSAVAKLEARALRTVPQTAEKTAETRRG